MHTIKTIGLIGGGQLGKMLAQEAARMSVEVIILDPNPDCPASALCKKQIVAPFKDKDAIRKLAEKCDVLTYEIEQGNADILRQLENEGFRIYPSPENLATIQDKLKQKMFLKQHSIPVCEFESLDTIEALPRIAKQFGFPFLLKARTDGYDGRGNLSVTCQKDLDLILKTDHYKKNSRAYMAEKFVDFVQEISVMVARNQQGQTCFFPVAENIHRDHILHVSLAPARISLSHFERAQKIAQDVINSLGGVGIFGVEMFLCHNGEILVNEIAPRTHNSGHYTIEACQHSQFEMHLRAILDWPIIDPVFKGAAVMMNVLGDNSEEAIYRLDGIAQLLSYSGVKLHWYGKQTARNARKLGHINVLDDNIEKALEKSDKVRNLLKIVPLPKNSERKSK